MELLRRRDMTALVDLARTEANTPSALVALLSETDDLLRWRAIEGLGHLAAHLAESGGLDVVRDLVRRQFWTMTEESGGIAWHAPEAIAEMLFRVPVLSPDFATVLLSNGQSAPFEAGVHWGAARLCEGEARAILAEEVPTILEGLAHPLPAVRGHAARALGRIGDHRAKSPLAALVTDEGAFERYDFQSGALVKTTVGDEVQWALKNLSEGEAGNGRTTTMPS